MKKLILIYDFDKTLSPKYMQEYGFFQALNTDNEDFMQKQIEFCIKNNSDMILSFLFLALKKANENGVKLTKALMKKCGKNIKYFNGVETWFERINRFGLEHGVEVEHYIISCGNKEILEGSSIYKNFKEVFATEYLFDENKEAYWPKVLVNYTTKTQCLFKIRKQLFHDNFDETKINKKYKPEDLFPFKNMVYLGDGETDVPCMQIIKSNGGMTLSLYAEKGSKKEEFAKSLYSDGRVDYAVLADYSENNEIDMLIKNRILEKAK